MIRRIIQLSIVMLCLLTTSGAWGTTYYIDWMDGDDNNDGTSKSTPWKRAPGMRGCWVGDTGGKCNAKRAARGAPGDQFILKGGVTWPKEALPWDWYFGSGTEANPIYFGVDQSWYAGSSWSRPILNNGGTELTPLSPERFPAMMRVYGYWYVVDNIEFTGLAQLHGARDMNMYYMLVTGYDTAPGGGEVKNNYFHGWSHGAIDGEGRWVGGVDAGKLAGDNCFGMLVSSGTRPNYDLKVHHNVFDGSDTTGDMMKMFSSSAAHTYNNYFSNVPNAMLTGGGKYYWGNTFKNIGTTLSFDLSQHHNAMYIINNPVAIIYNNFLDNTGGGVTFWVDPSGSNTIYLFNNVSINDGNQGVQISNERVVEGSTAGVEIFNNTFHGKSGIKFSRISGPVYNFPNVSFVTVRNNHFITDGPSVVFNKVTTQTSSDNIVMTNANATQAGYVATGNTPFAPPAGGVTVGVGKDLTSLAAGIPSTEISDAATAALSDTSMGVAYDTVRHNVIGPNRSPKLRGTTWDIGAYQGEHQSIAPPQKLRVIP